MKKSKYLFVVVIALFFFFPSAVKAKCGDLIYEVTKFSVNDEKIIFEGWAFIHFTNNSKDKKVYGSVSYGGGQEVMIVAENKSTGEKKYLKNILYNGYSGSNADNLKKYNFYYMQFFDKANGNVENEYSNNYNHLTGRYDANSCNITDRSCGASECYQCLFEDIGFHIEANISSFNASETAEYNFYIYATNDDYNSKYNRGICYGTGSGNLKGKKDSINYNNRHWAGSEIYIANSAKSGSSDKIKVNTEAISENKVYTTVEHGLPRVFYNGNYHSIGYYIDNAEFEYTGRIDDTDCYYKYKCGPGDYIIRVDSSGTSPGTYTTAKIYRSWAVPAGKATLALTFISDKKCDVDTGGPESLSCNGTKKIISDCNELTVHDNGKSAVVSVKQTGVLANLLSPTEIYNGGGIKFGLLYYNRVEFNYVSGSKDVNITDVMNKRISGYENIFLDKIKIGNINVDSSHMIKECKQIKESNYTDTICVFYFGPQTVNENGTIIDGGTDLGINNKYYLPLDYTPVYRVSASLMNASLLDGTKAKEDSKNNNKAWYGTKWDEIVISDDLDNSCDINIYKLGPKTNRFVYRPIDLNNPFPNRNAGLNWYTWYAKDSNKDRLKDSYKNLDYSIEIDNIAINKIKKYNKSTNYFNFDFNDFIKEVGLKIEEGGNS